MTARYIHPRTRVKLPDGREGTTSKTQYLYPNRYWLVSPDDGSEARWWNDKALQPHQRDDERRTK